MVGRSNRSSVGSDEDTNGSASSTQDFSLNSSGSEKRICICNRENKTLVCLNCKMFTYGRAAHPCPEHPNVTFLMDLFYCPHCQGPKSLLRKVDVDDDFGRDINANIPLRPNGNNNDAALKRGIPFKDL